MRIRTPVTGAAVVVLAIGLSSCGSSSAKDSPSKSRDATTLVVLADSSFSAAFNALKGTFESEQPGVTVRFVFGSSAALGKRAAQEGGSADVLATADQTSMKTVAAKKLTATAPRQFATNSLVVVTPPDNPGKVAGIGDLENVPYATCAPSTSCGTAAAGLLALDHVSALARARTGDARNVIAELVRGDVDAGLVYGSDATAAGRTVRTIAADNASEVVSADPIAVLRKSADPDAASAWVDLVLSGPGQQTLSSYGFGADAD